MVLVAVNALLTTAAAASAAAALLLLVTEQKLVNFVEVQVVGLVGEGGDGTARRTVVEWREGSQWLLARRVVWRSCE